MASLTLEQMEQLGLNQVCLDLCQNILNTQIKDGSELKHLLPVRYIINNWNSYDQIEWVHPITEESHIEQWELGNEKQRLEAIDKTNERIDEYNKEVEKLDSQYKDIVERVEKQRFRPLTHFQKHQLTVWCVQPVHRKSEKSFEKKPYSPLPFDSRQFNNQEIFERLALCKSEEEAVGRFNQMLYEYILAVTKDKPLVETSTFYYPLMEFEDYMMRTQAKFTNLLYGDKKYLISNTYPFELLNDEVLVGNVDIRSKEWKVKDFWLVLDWDNQTIALEYVTNRGKTDPRRGIHTRWVKDSATFYECGFIGNNRKPNRWMILLFQFANFLEVSKDKPHIEKASLFEEIVINGRKKNTFNKYLKALDRKLGELLWLKAPIFTEVKEKSTMRGATGKKITTTHKYFDTEMKMELKSYSEELRETTKDGFMESYSSDTDTSVQ